MSESLGTMWDQIAAILDSAPPEPLQEPEPATVVKPWHREWDTFMEGRPPGTTRFSDGRDVS